LRKADQARRIAANIAKLPELVSLFLIAKLIKRRYSQKITFEGNAAMREFNYLFCYELARDQKVEILVADINMSGLSGVQLAERASGFGPKLPVLLLSGRETHGDGFPVLQKPFSESDLRHTVEKTVGLCD
jgi:DNA-binding LytR/AlgR family response regulator